jgi:hypothetical protein
MVKIKTFIFDNRFDGGTVEIALKEVSRKELTRIIEFLDEIEGGKPAEQALPVQETHNKPILMLKISGENKTGKRKAMNWKHIEEEISKTLKDKEMTRKEILKCFDRNKAIVIKLLIKMERSGALKTEQIDKFGTKRYSLPEVIEQKPVEISLNYSNLRQALWDAYESNEKAVWAKDFKKCDIMTKGSPEEFLRRLSEDTEFREKVEKSVGLRLNSTPDCLMITGMVMV